MAKCHGTRTTERLRGTRRDSTDDTEARRVVDGEGLVSAVITVGGVVVVVARANRYSVTGVGVRLCTGTEVTVVACHGYGVGVTSIVK